MLSLGDINEEENPGGVLSPSDIGHNPFYIAVLRLVCYWRTKVF